MKTNALAFVFFIQNILDGSERVKYNSSRQKLDSENLRRVDYESSSYSYGKG